MAVAEVDEKPRRAVTESIVETVLVAKAHPGEWVPLTRSFKTKSNAHVTASCVRRGFLRVRPMPGDKEFVLGDHAWLGLPAKCAVKVEQVGDSWSLWLYAPASRRVVRRRKPNVRAAR